VCSSDLGTVAPFFSHPAGSGTKFDVYLYNNGGTLTLRMWFGGADRNNDWAPSAKTWYHIAFARSSGVIRTYVNGTQVGTDWANAGSVSDSPNSLYLGNLLGAGYYLNAIFDEVRFSNVARWTGNFTVPTTAYSSTIPFNMILQSIAFVAHSTPNDAKITLFEEDVDAITLNTDLKAWASRDNGTTWSQITLENEGNYVSTKRILSGVVDIINQPVQSTYNMKYKITTHNNKNLKLYGVSEIW
jgi:hypothetical protein